MPWWVWYLLIGGVSIYNSANSNSDFNKKDHTLTVYP